MAVEFSHRIEWYPSRPRWWERLAMALGLMARFTPVFPVYAAEQRYTIPASFAVTRADLEAGDELYRSIR